MPSPSFIHLRLHSEYSISDGIVRLGAVVTRAVADGMPALALTDLANLFGMVKFYTAARSAGIKALIGCDVWVADPSAAAGSRDPLRDNQTRMLLLVRNRAGYLRLCELLTAAYLGPRRRGRAEISRTARDLLKELGRDFFTPLARVLPNFIRNHRRSVTHAVFSRETCAQCY